MPLLDPLLVRRVKVGAVCSLLVIAAAVALSLANGDAGAAPSTGTPPPTEPPSTVPRTDGAVPPGQDVYTRAASTCPGLTPQVLAAVHHVESRGARSSDTSPAGARGPMQFLPSTWRAYGVDGDGDGRADINDLADAVFSAANHLCANGAGDPSRLRSALWNYNHSKAYVERVLQVAATA